MKEISTEYYSYRDLPFQEINIDEISKTKAMFLVNFMRHRGGYNVQKMKETIHVLESNNPEEIEDKKERAWKDFRSPLSRPNLKSDNVRHIQRQIFKYILQQCLDISIWGEEGREYLVPFLESTFSQFNLKIKKSPQEKEIQEQKERNEKAIKIGDIGADLTHIFASLTKNNSPLLRELSESYKGIYRIYRYNAHLNVQENEVQEPARVMRALIHILPISGMDLYRRYIAYYPNNAPQDSNIHEEHGIVIPIKTHIYCIGRDEQEYPITMVFRDLKGRKTINGLSLRCHSKNRLMATRFHWVKIDQGARDDETILEEEKKLLSIYNEDGSNNPNHTELQISHSVEVKNYLAKINSILVNKPQNQGRGSLVVKGEE